MNFSLNVTLSLFIHIISMIKHDHMDNLVEPRNVPTRTWHVGNMKNLNNKSKGWCKLYCTKAGTGKLCAPTYISKIMCDMKFNINLVGNDRLKFAVLSRLFIYVCLCENNIRDYDTLQMLCIYISSNLFEEYILSCYIYLSFCECSRRIYAHKLSNEKKKSR